MKVLITGAAGYIGSRVVEGFLEKGAEVIAVDNFLHGDNRLALLQFIGYPKFRFYQEDVLDRSENLQNLMDEADYIIPLAALVGFPICEKKKKLTVDTNQKTIEWMVDYCSGKGKRFIFPTTNSGYGATDGKTACTEESPLSPVSHYGITKVAAEKYVIDHAEEYVTLRLATVFGVSYRMRLDLLVNNFVWKAYKEGFNVLYEANSMRNYVHILDVVDAFLFLVDNWDSVRNQIYNLGNDSVNCSKAELAAVIDEQVPHTIINDEFGTDPDKRNYIVSSKKLSEKGFECTRTIESEIKKLITAYRMIDVPQYANY